MVRFRRGKGCISLLSPRTPRERIGGSTFCRVGALFCALGPMPGARFAVPCALSPSDLNIYAAASLRESFEAIARRFETSHPGVHVHCEFGGSQDLAAQINQGAPADVFASASPKELDRVAYDPSTRRICALNRLVVVSPSSKPLGSLRM